MRKVSPITQTIDCAPIDSPLSEFQETAFEKQRGISHVDVRAGFCQVHVVEMAKPLPESRLNLLKALADNGVSIDFLKLTPNGMSFVAMEEKSSDLEETLTSLGVKFAVRKNRAIVSVYAVNMRDEEGLIAEVVKSAIASGAQIDHIGDGHDRILMTVGTEQAQSIRSYFEKSLSNPSNGKDRKTA